MTYLGFVNGTRAALQRMKPRNKWTIVQVGSALAYRSIPLQSPYCGAKHAIIGFIDSLRSELLHDNLRVHLTVVQLPAMNTPQFSWRRTKLPRHPQPVPPIFQPEVAARAIYWAAHHQRREIYVGWPTVKAISGQEAAPGYADEKLASMAWGGQETSQSVASERPDNLFSPAPGNWEAHGFFDERASAWSLQSWANLHRGLLATMGVGLAGLALAAVRRRS